MPASYPRADIFQAADEHGREAGFGRVPELDGVRGLAILLVLVWHYFCDQIRVAPHTPFYFLARICGMTWSGVDLFFVLSGFLIGGILMDQRGAANYFQVFYIRRICRIFPLYYAMLAAFWICWSAGLPRWPPAASLFDNSVPFWSYTWYAQNIFMGLQQTMGPGFLSVTWSLAIEEQFYLFLPLVIRLTPRRLLPGLLYGLILVAPALRGWFPSPHAALNLPFRFDALLWGVLLAYAVRQPAFLEWIRARLGRVYGLFGLLLLGTAWITIAGCVFSSIMYFWLALLYTLFILLVLAHPSGPLARAMCQPVLRWFGQLSYGIYILHQVISWIVHGLLRGARPEMRDVSDAGVTLCALAVTLSLALLSYHGFEKRILAIGHTFRYRHPAPASA